MFSLHTHIHIYIFFIFFFHFTPNSREVKINVVSEIQSQNIQMTIFRNYGHVNNMCFWNLWDFPSSMIPHHICCQWVLNAGRKTQCTMTNKRKRKKERKKNLVNWARRMTADCWPTYFLFGSTIICSIKETRSRKALTPLPCIVHMNMAKSLWCSVFALK